GAVSALREGLHRFRPAVEDFLRLARLAMEERSLEHGGHRQLQVAAGELGQAVLVGNDLSLLGDLDGTVDRPERLSEDRLVGGPTAPAHGAAAAVEEPKRHAVAAGGAAQ